MHNTNLIISFNLLSLVSWGIPVRFAWKSDFVSPLPMKSHFCITLLYHTSFYTNHTSQAWILRNHTSEVWLKVRFHESHFSHTFKVCLHMWSHGFFSLLLASYKISWLAGSVIWKLNGLFMISLQMFISNFIAVSAW